MLHRLMELSTEVSLLAASVPWAHSASIRGRTTVPVGKPAPWSAKTAHHWTLSADCGNTDRIGNTTTRPKAITDASMRSRPRFCEPSCVVCQGGTNNVGRSLDGTVTLSTTSRRFDFRPRLDTPGMSIICTSFRLNDEMTSNLT